MTVSRKRVALTADTGTVVGQTSRVVGEVTGVGVDKGTLVQANTITFSLITDTGSGTLPAFVRSSDTGYDALSAGERLFLSGEKLQVSMASADTGEFGLSGVVYVYVKDD